MKEIRMMTAVKPFKNKILAWLYAFAAIFLLVLFIKFGSYIGGLFLWSSVMALPSDVLQFLMFTIDPCLWIYWSSYFQLPLFASGFGQWKDGLLEDWVFSRIKLG